MSPGPPDHAPRRPIRGRQEELRQLDGLLTRRGAGADAVAVITGAAGLGKTTLVEYAARRAESTGMSVITGRVAEWATGRPFAPFLDALDDPVGREDAVADLESPGAYRHVVGTRLLDQLDKVAAAGPAILVLEDMHQADEASLWLLERLVRQSEGLPVTVLVTRRPDPRNPVLDRIEERRGVLSLRLAPLATAHLLEIASDVLGREPDDGTSAALEDAGGSPLMAMLLAELSTDDASERPRATMELVTQRMESLRPETIELVGAASILGSRFRLDDLATLVDMSAYSLVPHIEEAADVGLLHVLVDEIGFRHDLVWRAIYLGVPEPVRLGLHRDFAHRVAERDGSQERAIPHLVIGSSPGDVDQLQRAAEQVAGRDPTTAAGLYERALELCDETDPRRPELVVGLVNTLLWSGQFYRARTRAERMLASQPDPAIEGELRRVRARVLVYQGRVEESLAETERALERPLPPLQRARLLADVALRRLVCADLRGATDAADESTRLADTVDDTVARALARCARSRVDSFDGRVESAVEIVRSALEPSGGEPREAIEALQPRLYLGLALIDADRIEEAGAVFIEGRRLAEQRGSAWMVPLFHLGSTVEAHLVGDWDRALVEAETGLAAAEELHISVWSPWTHAVAGLIELARSPVDAMPHLQAIADHIDATGAYHFGGPWLTWARMRQYELQGQLDVAVAHGLEDWHRVGPGALGDRRLYAVELIRLLERSGDPNAAHPVLGILRLSAERSGTPADISALMHADGLLSADPTPIIAAAERYRTTSRPAFAARALEDAARLSGADADQVRGLAEQAATIYEALGASGESMRVESLLRSVGVRRGVRAPRKRARTGWESVTDTERQVLRLVADGLTNRQIAARMYLSPRTIETHVSHLFTKLEVSSRAELAARFADRRARNPEDA